MGRRKLNTFDLKMCDSHRNAEIAHLKGRADPNIINNAKDSELFAALKLIEELYRNNRITKKDFSDILIEYADRVDTGKFMVAMPSPGELLKEVPQCMT